MLTTIHLLSDVHLVGVAISFVLDVAAGVVATNFCFTPLLVLSHVAYKLCEGCQASS